MLGFSSAELLSRVERSVRLKVSSSGWGLPRSSRQKCLLGFQDFLNLLFTRVNFNLFSNRFDEFFTKAILSNCLNFVLILSICTYTVYITYKVYITWLEIKKKGNNGANHPVWTLSSLKLSSSSLSQMMTMLLTNGVDISVFSLQFLDWWYDESNKNLLKEVLKRTVPPPPSSSLNAKKNYGKDVCPICSR